MAGTCANCASNCATCTAGATGGVCTACASGFSLTYPNTCVTLADVATTATATGVWSFGANAVPNAVVCQSTPLAMPVSRTAAFLSITLTTNAGATTISANSGDGSCFGCATAPPAVTGAGYQTSVPNEVYTWQLSFPTRSSAQMCVSRPNGGAPLGTWTDDNLRIAYAIVNTTCGNVQVGAGEYIDANFVCRKCPAGTYGATTPLVGAQCSGVCPAGTYSKLGASSCSATGACPIGQYRNQTTGACAVCAGAATFVDQTGAQCVASCPAGAPALNGQCTPSAADATYSDIFLVGANANVGVLQCAPVTMAALSSTAALKSVAFEVKSGVNVYAVAAGQCYGCASQVMPTVQSGA